MKKALVLICLLASIYSIKAQSIADKDLKTDVSIKYITVFEASYGIGKLAISVDYGQQDRKKTAEVKDDLGKTVEFKSSTEALNFFAKYGWELVGFASSGSDPSISRFVLKRIGN